MIFYFRRPVVRQWQNVAIAKILRLPKAEGSKITGKLHMVPLAMTSNQKETVPNSNEDSAPQPTGMGYFLESIWAVLDRQKER